MTKLELVEQLKELAYEEGDTLKDAEKLIVNYAIGQSGDIAFWYSECDETKKPKKPKK